MTDFYETRFGHIAKGLTVRARGYVQSGYFSRGEVCINPVTSMICDPGEREYHSSRMLVRWAIPFEGIAVGVSHRVTGLNDDRKSRWKYGIGASLENEERHLVVMVQPTHTPRYRKPKACLLEDLETQKNNSGG